MRAGADIRRLAGVALFLAASCSRPGSESSDPAAHPSTVAPPPPSPAPAVHEALSPAAALEGARGVYAGRCSTCHGREGRGDGPAALAFTPRPRNFHDAVWQGVTSDEAIRGIVLKGGPAVGKSSAMPANLDLVSQPEVVAQLVTVVRGFGPGKEAEAGRP